MSTACSVGVKSPLTTDPAVPDAHAPVVGQPAPAIELNKLINAPDGTSTSWDALRGKVVVLEFWATWCGPCVAAIPGMNEIKVAHENDPIVFIHITDEDESTVQKFLRRTPIDGWVGIDEKRQTFVKYGITGRPTVAVVGKDGRFLGWSDPRVLILEPEILKDVLAKGSSERLSRNAKGPPVDPLAGVGRDDPTRADVRNLLDLIIRKSDETSAKHRGGGDSRGYWSFESPLINHIGTFCHVPTARIVVEAPLPEGRYDVIAMTRKGSAPQWKEAVCHLIAATFDLSLTYEQQLMDVYVLKPAPAREMQLTRSVGMVYLDDERRLSAPTKEILERMKQGETFFFAMCPVSWLADSVSGGDVDRPVVAELGNLAEEYPDVYTICFPYEKGDVERLIRGLEEHVGLTLVPDEREVEVLVVRLIEQGASGWDR